MFILAYPAVVASGLLIAPLMALAAMIITPLRLESWTRIRWPWVTIPAGLFLVWVSLSFLWSPHDDPQQIPKLLFGVPLYALFAFRVGSQTGVWRARIEAALIFFVFAACLFFFFEAMTGGSATYAFKAGAEDLDGAASDVRFAVNRSLGHGVAPLLLIAGPAILLSWKKGGPLLGGILVAMVLMASLSFDMQVNTVGMLLGVAGMALAWFFPRQMVAVSFGGLAGGVLAMPLLLPNMVGLFPDEMRSVLPDSWAWRLETWVFVTDLIAQSPLVGHGLDASRHLSEISFIDGVEVNNQPFAVDLLPLHPHNSALHVWLETGLVGAGLLAVALIGLGERLNAAKSLTKFQAMAIIWVVWVYASLLLFSYGAWQEWHQGAVALATTAILLLHSGKSV